MRSTLLLVAVFSSGSLAAPAALPSFTTDAALMKRGEPPASSDPSVLPRGPPVVNVQTLELSPEPKATGAASKKRGEPPTSIDPPVLPRGPPVVNIQTLDLDPEPQATEAAKLKRGQPASPSGTSMLRRGPPVVNIQILDLDPEPQPTGAVALAKRKKETSVSCKPSNYQWSIIDDLINKNVYPEVTLAFGFRSAINSFCDELDGVAVPYKKKITAQIAKIRLTHGLGDGNFIGEIENNSFPNGFMIISETCQNWLGNLVDKTHCYGSKNDDTSGGRVSPADRMTQWSAWVQKAEKSTPAVIPKAA